MIESQFTRSIHKLLPNTVYAWKINDRFTAGVPDAWYSGVKRDLWVEYKFDKKPPKVIKLALTARQLSWLNQQHDKGRNIAVIYGTPLGGFVFQNKEWGEPQPYKQLEDNSRLLTRQGLAAWIADFVNA